MLEDKDPSEEAGRVSSLINQLIKEANRDDVPEHLRALARQLELALARRMSKTELDD